MNFSFIVFSIVLGVGLAMDAFSVSLANGLKEPSMTKKKICIVGLAYAVFQAVMPMIGWVCVHTIVEKFKNFEKFIPWIALVLLLYIGGEMLADGIKAKKSDEEVVFEKLTYKVLLVQAVATSIDALSVGFTIAKYPLVSALVCNAIIALVTFIISVVGVLIGKKIGTRLGWKADILGGIILIGIGLEIFITGVFF
ncbi:MAG: manganese efflux pump [Oscillospiraceae bacterium]|nr:manganese efflux pump [Candidatus Limimonas coprohippi]MCQ2488219.1 manganese efflux pump MntP family protein [Clostridia bacterium]